MRAFLIIPLFLPVGVEYHTRRFPVVTFTIMGLCAAVHLLSMFIWLNGGDEADLDFMLTLGFVRETPNAYSWLTHMFTHGDIFHLLGNMIYLFLFGSCVEDLLGRVRYVIFYVLGGLAALAIFLLLAPEPLPGEPPVPLVGASGAISACMGAFFLVLHHARITIKWIVFFFFRIFSGDWHLPAKLVMSFWFLLDVLGTVASLEDTGGGVAFSAHVGGFLAGLGLMAVIKHGFGLLTEKCPTPPSARPRRGGTGHDLPARQRSAIRPVYARADSADEPVGRAGSRHAILAGRHGGVALLGRAVSRPVGEATLKAVAGPPIG